MYYFSINKNDTAVLVDCKYGLPILDIALMPNGIPRLKEFKHSVYCLCKVPFPSEETKKYWQGLVRLGGLTALYETLKHE